MYIYIYIHIYTYIHIHIYIYIYIYIYARSLRSGARRQRGAPRSPQCPSAPQRCAIMRLRDLGIEMRNVRYGTRSAIRNAVGRDGVMPCWVGRRFASPTCIPEERRRSGDALVYS